MCLVSSSAVVMLSHAMDGDGQLDEQSAARAQLAAQVFTHKQADFLVTNGWAYRDDVDHSIATAVKRHLINHYKIDSQVIVAEPNSRDTVGDAYFSKTSALMPRGIDTIWVITSEYHIDRAREIFSFIYGPDIELNFCTVAAPDAGDMRASEKRSIEAFRNTFRGITAGDNTKILERIKQAHPFYNGDVYPILQVLSTE